MNISPEFTNTVKHKIDFKTKPIGALGKLEEYALQICKIQDTLNPKIQKPTLLLFAADHGIALEGVSAYPQDVTWQMVLNFLQGGAAINVFAKQNNIVIKIIDAGVNYNFSKTKDVNTNYKIAMGTHSFLNGNAMSTEQYTKAINAGETIINDLHNTGCNTVLFGEMGIGNTSSAAMLMSLLQKENIDQCVGKGTGVDDAGLKKKLDILKNAHFHHYNKIDVEEIIAAVGGFEIAMMCGAMIAAANKKMILLVDGFISSAALLAASKINNTVLNYCFVGHLSNEQAHENMLKNMGIDPILNLNMRLGEGTGAALALNILHASVNFLNEMASFESAGVSNK